MEKHHTSTASVSEYLWKNLRHPRPQLVIMEKKLRHLWPHLVNMEKHHTSTASFSEYGEEEKSDIHRQVETSDTPCLPQRTGENNQTSTASLGGQGKNRRPRGLPEWRA